MSKASPNAKEESDAKTMSSAASPAKGSEMGRKDASKEQSKTGSAPVPEENEESKVGSRRERAQDSGREASAERDASPLNSPLPDTFLEKIASIIEPVSEQTLADEKQFFQRTAEYTEEKWSPFEYAHTNVTEEGTEENTHCFIRTIPGKLKKQQIRCQSLNKLLEDRTITTITSIVVIRGGSGYKMDSQCILAAVPYDPTLVPEWRTVELVEIKGTSTVEVIPSRKVVLKGLCCLETSIKRSMTLAVITRWTGNDDHTIEAKKQIALKQDDTIIIEGTNEFISENKFRAEVKQVTINDFRQWGRLASDQQWYNSVYSFSPILSLTFDNPFPENGIEITLPIPQSLTRQLQAKPFKKPSIIRMCGLIGSSREWMTCPLSSTEYKFLGKKEENPVGGSIQKVKFKWNHQVSAICLVRIAQDKRFDDECPKVSCELLLKSFRSQMIELLVRSQKADDRKYVIQFVTPAAKDASINALQRDGYTEQPDNDDVAKPPMILENGWIVELKLSGNLKYGDETGTMKFIFATEKLPKIHTRIIESDPFAQANFSSYQGGLELARLQDVNKKVQGQGGKVNIVKEKIRNVLFEEVIQLKKRKEMASTEIKRIVFKLLPERNKSVVCNENIEYLAQEIKTSELSILAQTFDLVELLEQPATKAQRVNISRNVLSSWLQQTRMAEDKAKVLFKALKHANRPDLAKALYNLALQHQTVENMAARLNNMSVVIGSLVKVTALKEKWMKLGKQLGMSDTFLGTLDNKHKKDNEKAMKEMMERWIQAICETEKDNLNPVLNEYDLLGDAIEKMEMKYLADHIRFRGGLLKGDAGFHYYMHKRTRLDMPKKKTGTDKAGSTEADDETKDTKTRKTSIQDSPKSVSSKLDDFSLLSEASLRSHRTGGAKKKNLGVAEKITPGTEEPLLFTEIRTPEAYE